MNTLIETRISVLARMAKVAPRQSLGRTQVMKLFYFLQELKGVHLGYDFRLFTYGPFDSEVLSDLSSACNLGVVTEKTVIYPRGYGYDIAPSTGADAVVRELEDANPSLALSVDEIIKEFGQLGAAELELQSTILYVDREFAAVNQSITADEVSTRVQQIKPHFTRQMINDRISTMTNKGFLSSLSA